MFAWREGADLVLKVPHPGAVDGGQAQHVPLVQVHGRDLLAAGQGRRHGLPQPPVRAGSEVLIGRPPGGPGAPGQVGVAAKRRFAMIELRG